MNIAEIELKLKALSEKPFDPGIFPYALLEIYDTPRATITKIQNGSMNKGELSGDVLWKGKLFFRPAADGDVANTLEGIKQARATSANKPRFLVASDGKEVSVYDTKADEPFHKRWPELNELFDVFLPLAGVERYMAAKENPADIKAAGRLAKFYDAILECNPDWKKPEFRHQLNLFMTRTLFCLFAEDTGIFAEGLFSRTADEFTLEDGSDTHEVLKTVFDVMDVKDDRKGYPQFAKDFPYVNGGLFREKTEVPRFSKKARRLLLDACQLKWSEINPDIFGSMIQAVVDPSMRGDLGMHYTSVPNIMKVIGPLFLDKLKEEFEAAKDSPKRLERLLTRIYRIRVFDPACGSGNFLIISYRELRRLEMRIFKRLQEISPQFALPMSQVRLSQFYGIEYADFAAETAKLSLWIAEMQANKEFEEVFGAAPPSLPLKDSGRVVQGNALRVNWKNVCPPDENSETYIVGNPPYLGGTSLEPEQKEDMASVFSSEIKSYKYLDYVTCWFLRGADYSRDFDAECAFVATNSICQGEQVGLLWPLMFQRGMEINFAHQSFKWTNNATRKAAVTCIIVGFGRVKSRNNKVLYIGEVAKPVDNISPYLLETENIIVFPRTKPLSSLVPIDNGSKPTDDGNLFLNNKEKEFLIAHYPETKKFLRRAYGSKEFINDIERWCLWISDDDVQSALDIPEIKARIDKVRKFRESSPKIPTQQKANIPYKFDQIRHQDKDQIIVPRHFSENRRYLTVGILDGLRSVVTDACFVINNAPMTVFSILSSRLFLVWTAVVGGRIKTDYRFSNTLVYNTFPIADLSTKQRQALEQCAWRIIEEREANIGKTIAELYEPEDMPKGLLDAHRELDVTLETIYRGRPFRDDTERLEHLFKLYAAKTGKNGAKTRGRAA